MRRGFSSVFRKLVCISLLLFTSFYLLPYLLVHEDAYSEQQLYEDLNACDDNRVYKGYTHPCDIQGVDKDSFERVLKKRASTDGKILLMMVDRGSLDFSINLYLTSLVKQGLRNYLFVSVDKSTCVELLRRNISCHVYREDRDAGHDSVYYSKDFLRKMNYRTFIILDALKLGYTVLHSDVDMFFYKNPFDEISCEWKACDMAMLNDYNMAKRISTFNAGFVYMNPTSNTIEVYKRMAWMAFHLEADDQMQLNKAIRESGGEWSWGFNSQKSNLKVFYLKKEHFLSGSYFWKDGVVSFLGDVTWPNPVVVHNNWMVSIIAKEFRFKEMQMWMYDKDNYYSNPYRRYLLYNNPYVFESSEKTFVEEIWALRNALAIGQILGRTVILPSFHCESTRCNILHHLSLRHLHREFPNFREHIFLQHPSVPESVKHSVSDMCTVNSGSDNSVVDREANGGVSHYKSVYKQGATEQEIVEWFGSDSSSVLQFKFLYNAFYRFDDEAVQKDFDGKVTRAFRRAGYVQRDSEMKDMVVNRKQM